MANDPSSTPLRAGRPGVSESASYGRTFAGAFGSSDVNMMGISFTLSGTPAPVPATGTSQTPARRIISTTAGVLNVQYPNGVTQLVTFAANQAIDIDVAWILHTSTTLADFMVFW